MSHPVIHCEIGGHEAEKLKGFYADLFGWESIPAGPGYWLVAPQDGGIGGGIMQATADMPRYVTVYVRVDGLEATLRRVAELGGRVLVPPTDIPGVGAFALFQDIEENIIGLMQMTTK
ncbi:MAG: VOC family protein [Actinomycetota bacterium]